MNFCDTRHTCPKSETIWWQEHFHEFESLGTHVIAQFLFAASVIGESVAASVHVSYYWAYSNRKICYFVFILLTMENDFFHDFGPFILFIILWLLMSHPFTSVIWKHFLLENIPCNFFPWLLFELSFFILFPSNIFPRFNMNPKDIGYILIKTLEIEGIYP